MSINYLVLTSWLVLLTVAITITIGLLPAGMSLAMVGLTLFLVASVQERRQ